MRKQRRKRSHSAKRPWMPWYVGDFMKDTRHLTCQQDGAYRRLIDFYWVTGKIPHDDGQLAQIVGLPIEEWMQERPVILAFFNPDFTHNRIEIELKKCRQISRKRRKSAKTRHEKPRQPIHPIQESVRPQVHANALHLHPHSDSHAQATTTTESRSLISEAAGKLADELAIICGHDPEFLPPTWISPGPYRIAQNYIDAGYSLDMMRAVAKARRRKLGRPIASPNYLTPIFAEAHAKAQQAALPIGPVLVSANPELNHESNRSRRRSGGFASLSAAIRAKSSGPRAS